MSGSCMFPSKEQRDFNKTVGKNLNLKGKCLNMSRIGFDLMDIKANKYTQDPNTENFP